jgi:hypothetical protein
MSSSSEQILTEALSWPGVSREQGRFGAVALRMGRRELGHLHGDAVADVPLPRSVRDKLITDGSVRQHQWRPDSGWVTVPLSDEESAQRVLALLRSNYERGLARASNRRPSISG